MDAVGTDTQSLAPTSAPPTPQRTEQIASAALGLFLDHGVDRTTLREIADRAGLSKSGLYHYVAAKADILDLIVGPYIAALDAVVAAAAPSKLDALRSAVHVEIIYRDVARLISTDVTAATHARAAGFPRVLDQVHDLLEPAPGGQTARHLARAAWAAATEITASLDASDIRRIEPLAVSIARAVLNVQAPDADSST